MLKGDLTSTPLAPLLVQLAEDASTGCLHISEVEGDEALVYFKNGLVYAVSVPGRRPQLGAKLISSGALAPEALADALEAQRTELQGWRLGELLVHLGYVDQPVVEAFIKEQVHDALWDLIKWVDGRWKFRKAEKTREDVAPPMPVVDLLSDLRERGYEWQAISTVVHGPTAVPVLSARGGGEPETTLDPDAWSMLCKIDGERTVAELARDCGYTQFEAGQVLVALVNAGLVDIEEDLEVVPADADVVVVDEELYGAQSVSSALAADAADAAAAEIEGDDSFAELARLVTEVAATVREEASPAPAQVELPQPVRFNAGNDQSFAASIERVSAALTDVLGPAPQVLDPFEVPSELRIRRPKTAATEEEVRRTRARQAAAAELAAAHALAEALRASQQQPQAVAAPVEPETTNVVDLAAVRREAEAERVAAEEAARIAAEEAARVAAEQEAARLEAERVEAERLAAEEAARIAAEEAARLEAEQVEAERLAAEQEAARLEAERLAAEEAARFEAERLATEEAARLEAERVAVERANAEDEAWAEYWAREAQAAELTSQREAAASALLTQLSAEPVVTEEPVAEVPEPREEADEDPPAVREPATVGGRTGSMNEMADTAALLRELSSLGLEDEPSPPPAHAPMARPARPAAPEKKKKKGLFGF